MVAQFGSEGLFAFDMDGRLLWKKDLGVLDSGWFYDPTYQWGFSSSPVIYGDSVIAQVDIQKGSFIAAWDLATGRELWRTPREEISTWGTPTLLRGPQGDEIVTNGTTVRAYDPKTGALLWSLGPNSEVTVATPVTADGIVYVTAGYPPVQPVYAVRAGARGKLDLPADQTKSASVAWSVTKGGTYIPTPLVYRGLLYTLHNNGRLLCYDAKTGDMVYGARVGTGGTFTASPVAADGRLFIATEEGDVFVVRAGPQYELLGTNAMGEVVMATPAISDGVLLVRTLKHLYGLGESGVPRPQGSLRAFSSCGRAPGLGGHRGHERPEDHGQARDVGPEHQGHGEGQRAVERLEVHPAELDHEPVLRRFPGHARPERGLEGHPRPHRRVGDEAIDQEEEDGGDQERAGLGADAREQWDSPSPRCGWRWSRSPTRGRAGRRRGS